VSDVKILLFWSYFLTGLYIDMNSYLSRSILGIPPCSCIKFKQFIGWFLNASELVNSAMIGLDIPSLNLQAALVEGYAACLDCCTYYCN
jgi:hypothetical protein